MSDLISRSRAIENIWDVFNSYANDSQRFDEYETEAINNAFTVLQKTIENQPTAYDVEKVVAELEKELGNAQMEYTLGNYNLDNDIGNKIIENYRQDMNEGKCFALGGAIEIVKQGGVSDDVCEWRLCDEEANVYDTSCRNPHILIEGTPKENNYEYCPYCGKKIKVVE